ncbi:MAG: efflux RND transporter permease subunit [Candidatus Kapabacteria bacterium]|nr:efflux RND transporter permease subunit [Ignavibacteriota bacterium]MCW5885479.1 efflux RND transporter permease subunit [Candidatus Kapabacteria bacterium]
MSLSSLSIRRPILATVMSITIILFGIIGYTYLGVREYPSVDPAVITVSTTYIGANADVIETQITEPLEGSINGIAGIRSIKSVSRDGRSTITVEFNIEVDLENAANDVRDKVSRAQRSLPPDCDPPVVSKADADSGPILAVNLRSSSRNLLELTEIAQNVFKERMQTIDGVSEVNIWGSKRYSMRMWMDPKKLAIYGLTPLDIKNALNRENIELPSGLIEGRNTELTVRTLGRLYTVDDFNNLIIKDNGYSVVRFKDVGYSELFPENERTLLKRDGEAMVNVVVVPQPGANYINIVDECYKRIDIISRDLPDDVETLLGFDQTEFIRESIAEVKQTIFIAFFLVILIIFLFLRDWRTTLIPIIVIPIALIGSFFIMYIFNFSINVLTMLGLVLAIGLVVDDAIVVLENIYKKIELGMKPVEAGVAGAAEIFFAVIATTIALVAVFLPIMFLEGLTGRLFREFGVVIAGAVIISSFVALTLTPMLSTKLLRRREKQSKIYEISEPFFVGLTDLYRSSLDWFMTKRWLAFVVILASGGMIYFIGAGLQSELAPMEDRSEMRIVVNGAEGSTYEFMGNYINKLYREIDDNLPEKESIITITSPGFGASSSVNSGFIRIKLIKPEQRQQSQAQIADRISKIAKKNNDARAFVIQEQSIGTRRGGLPVQFVIQAQNIEKLKEFLPKFIEASEKDPTFELVDVNLKFSKPEIVIEINRNKSRDLGVSTQDIALTLQAAFSGQRFDYFVMNGKQYQVIGQLLRESRSMPVDLTSLYVKNSRGDLIQLDNLITIKERSSPPQLFRFNRFSSATVSASLASGKTIGDGILAMEKISKEILDDTFLTALDGPSKDFMESSSTLIYTFILALILIYLVLSAQFESFRDPFIIMFTVPLAISGAVISLVYWGETLNIFSQIGMIMLIGLVTKNGILIVEFANQQKAKGLGVVDAVKQAAVLRLRPILMTSLSTILGTLPIALAVGAGSGSRRSMGIAVIGGLIFSTILTLYVIPAVYSYFSDKSKSVSNMDLDSSSESIDSKAVNSEVLT